MTSKSSKEAATASSASSTSNSGLRLSNLTPPGSRKYGTYSMGVNCERSDSGYGGSGGSAAMLKTPPVGRKVATLDKGKLHGLQGLPSVCEFSAFCHFFQNKRGSKCC